MPVDKREEMLHRYYVLRKRYSNSITGLDRPGEGGGGFLIYNKYMRKEF